MCEDHFVDACFMNYKKERLVKTAVPTLQIAQNGAIAACKLDEKALAKLVYDFNDKGKSINLPDVKPALLTNESNDLTDNYINTETCSERSYSVSPITVPNKKPIVLNSACQNSIKRFAVKNVQEKRIIAPKTERIDDDIDVNRLVKRNRRNEKATDEVVTLVCTKTYTKSNAGNTYLLQDPLEGSYDDPSSSIQSTTESIIDLPTTTENHSNAADNTVYIQMMSEQMKKIEELKKIIADNMTTNNKAESNNGHASQPVAAAGAAVAAAPQPIRVEKCPPMSKVQLFNGIRKYLNPSMVALLRMEMFGSSDREYRVDEKQFAKELFELNQNVYDYMRDEWRFRLPPKADVETWIKSPDEDETWEVC